MTPQERQLVDDLFDRLSKLENAPRDPDAERLIAGGGKRAPHAIYALVQTALVQDEALKRANARIEELQAQLSDGEQQEQPHGSFLDSMRDAITGPRETRGSVPLVRPQAARAGFASPGDQPQSGYPPTGAPPQGPYSAGPAFGSGGSFLGTAASAAAGVIGGSLLLDGIRSMFGHHAGIGGQSPGAFGSVGATAAPWGAGAAADERTRDAGLDNISNIGTDTAGDQALDDAGAANAADDQDDTADGDSDSDNSDFDDDSNFDDGGGFDSGGTEDI